MVNPNLHDPLQISIQVLGLTCLQVRCIWIRSDFSNIEIRIDLFTLWWAPMWFDFISKIQSYFSLSLVPCRFICRLVTKENGLRWRAKGLKPNVPNQQDDPHNSCEKRPTLCAKIVVLHADTFYHSFLLFKSLYGCHRCYYYMDLLLFFMCCWK